MSTPFNYNEWAAEQDAEQDTGFWTTTQTNPRAGEGSYPPAPDPYPNRPPTSPCKLPPPIYRGFVSSSKKKKSPSPPPTTFTNPATAPRILPPQAEEIHETRITVICILGGPGSGKGTQSAKLVEVINGKKGANNRATHISIDAMMRAEMNRPGSAYAARIREAQVTGQLGDASVTFGILSATIREAFLAGFNTFVLDGYPRNMERLHFFQQNISPIHMVVYLTCSDDAMVQRLCTRGRADDNVEAVQKRIETFHRETVPVLAELKKKKDVYTRDQDASYYEIDAEMEPEVVEAKVRDVVLRALLIDDE